MKPENLPQYDDFLDYARRRKLSPSLINVCLTTLVRSRIAGDGSLFTDSILNTILEQPSSALSMSLSTFSNARGNIITNIVNESSFSKHVLTKGYSFQDIVDEALQGYLVYNPNKEIDENTLYILELREAIASYGHSHSSLAFLIEDLIAPANDTKKDHLNIKGAKYAVDKFCSYFIDAFTLGVMLMIHPFDIFKPDAKSLDSFEQLQYKYYKKHKRPMMIFLMYLRDCAKVSPEVLPDQILNEIVLNWDDDAFVDALDEMDEIDNKVESSFYDGCYFAAHKLEHFGVPIPLLLEKLNNISSPAEYPTWSHNEALLVFLNTNGKIGASAADILGVQKYSPSVDSCIEIIKANCGLIVPNPIWNDSVIDRLAYLINKSDVRECELDLFFQMYPSFVLDDLHCSSFPQVVLFKESGKHLRPDFLVQRIDSKYIDIVEIKRPLNTLITGTEQRPLLTREVAIALAQLKEYRDWFRNEGNRIWFRKKYGLEGYEPALTLVIGRSFSFKNETIRHAVLEGTGVNIITYDDLLNIAKRRKSLIVSQI